MAAMVGAVNRFRFAYNQKDLKALAQVFPSMPRELSQEWERSFKNCRTVTLTYSNVQPALLTPDTGIVRIRSTYTCQPPSRQAPIDIAQDDVFELQKAGDFWSIYNLGAMNAGRR